MPPVVRAGRRGVIAIRQRWLQRLKSCCWLLILFCFRCIRILHADRAASAAVFLCMLDAIRLRLGAAAPVGRLIGAAGRCLCVLGHWRGGVGGLMRLLRVRRVLRSGVLGVRLQRAESRNSRSDPRLIMATSFTARDRRILSQHRIP